MRFICFLLEDLGPNVRSPKPERERNLSKEREEQGFKMGRIFSKRAVLAGCTRRLSLVFTVRETRTNTNLNGTQVILGTNVRS